MCEAAACVCSLTVCVCVCVFSAPLAAVLVVSFCGETEWQIKSERHPNKYRKQRVYGEETPDPLNAHTCTLLYLHTVHMEIRIHSVKKYCNLCIYCIYNWDIKCHGVSDCPACQVTFIDLPESVFHQYLCGDHFWPSQKYCDCYNIDGINLSILSMILGIHLLELAKQSDPSSRPQLHHPALFGNPRWLSLQDLLALF